MTNRTDQIRQSTSSTNGTNTRYIYIKVDKGALDRTMKRLDSIIMNLNSLVTARSKEKVQITNAVTEITNLKAILSSSELSRKEVKSWSQPTV